MFKTAGIAGYAARAFDFYPFGVAEVGRKDEDNIAALIYCLFQGPDPVVPAPNGLAIKETADAIPSEPAIQFFDKILILTAMTEGDVMRGRGHWIMLPPAFRFTHSNHALARRLSFGQTNTPFDCTGQFASPAPEFADFGRAFALRERARRNPTQANGRLEWGTRLGRGDWLISCRWASDSRV